MGLRVNGDLVAHSRMQRETASILKFGVKLAFKTQQNMTLHAPMVCKVSRRVLNHPHAQVTEL